MVLPHPGVVCETKVFGESHKQPAPDTVLQKKYFMNQFLKHIVWKVIGVAGEYLISLPIFGESSLKVLG